MTGSRVPLRPDATVRDRPAGPDGEASTDPVIVLTYAHAGGERLSALLARYPDLACTVGTGILPLCNQAAAAWRAVDGRSDGPPSRLAETSTRALVASMITALLVRHGKRRWCEVATAAPDAAEAFTRLFPGARMVCLHRACPDVVAVGVKASLWGLAGFEHTPLISAHPVSVAAGLTASWAARTTLLLAFEEAHPGVCRRLRYEDLAADSLVGLSGFLGLADPDVGTDPAAWPYDEATDPAHGTPAMDFGFPAGQIPPTLLERANGLMKKLGYRPMGPAAGPASEFIP
jgi:protein-tyrosine sulfotransferase